MNKINIWIKNHHARWYLILFTIGILGGAGMNLLLGGSFEQGVLMASIYGFFLIIAEGVLGGSGVPDYEK